jgi:GT2 family glycosyltransferase
MIDMEKNAQREFRRLVPEWARLYYRLLRAWLLSAGLRAGGDFSLSNAERQASGMMSVIVAVHDAPEVTQRCLNSLEKFSGQAEVIVVDDGSKLEITRRMLDDFCSRNGWKLIRHDTALGHSRASEIGVSASTRPYVCLLNSDTVVTSHSWLGVSRAFDESPQIAAAGPSTSYTPTPQQVTRACHCRHHWSDGQIWHFSEKYVAKHQQEPVVDLPIVGGFAFFVRRMVWDELGGFDKNLLDYGNEKEFCRRLIQGGFRVVWTKAGYIHHLGSETYGKTLGLAAIRERCLKADAYIQNVSGR